MIKTTASKEYYCFHSEKLRVLPKNAVEQPAQQYLRYHNERFRG